MDIKIQRGKSIDALNSLEGSNSLKSESIKGADAAQKTDDPITNIAVDLIEGNISSTQAVDAILTESMNAEMISNAPTALRQEVEQVLKTTIETDPYLISLVSHLK